MRIHAYGIDIHYHIAEAIPGARLEIIPDAAHLSNIQQPELFNRLLMDFLTAN